MQDGGAGVGGTIQPAGCGRREQGGVIVDQFMTGATCVMCRRGVHYREGRVACDGCDLPTDSCLCEAQEGVGPPKGKSGETGNSALRALSPGPGAPPPRRPPRSSPARGPIDQRPGREPEAQVDPATREEPERAVHIAKEISDLEARAAEWERGMHPERDRPGRRRARRRRTDVTPAPPESSGPDDGEGDPMTGSGGEPGPTSGAGTPNRRLVRRRRRQEP